jgi:voltage-dependent calcium channel T type alpha-1G
LNKNNNFDNTLNAMLTLFTMTTTDGWVSIMFAGIDSVGPGMQPKKNSNIFTIMFFIAFMIVGS